MEDIGLIRILDEKRPHKRNQTQHSFERRRGAITPKAATIESNHKEASRRAASKMGDSKGHKKSNGFARHSSPLVPVLKKGGFSIRTAIDYRNLNQQSLDQTFPIASIQEALASLAQNSMSSTMDG